MDKVQAFIDHLLLHVERAKFQLQNMNIGEASRELYTATTQKPVVIVNKTTLLENLNQRFGTELASRFRKLKEEFGELMEVVDKGEYENNSEDHEDLLDEFADLTGVMFHISGILGKSQEELLAMVIDKLSGRDLDPNYKRKHPHVRKGGEV